MELRALGGMLDALFEVVRAGSPLAPTLLESADGEAAPVPDEHMMSYA